MKNFGTERYLTFEKYGEKDEFSNIKCTLSVPQFKLKGYKYLALPVRKIPGWLGSIDINLDVLGMISENDPAKKKEYSDIPVNIMLKKMDSEGGTDLRTRNYVLS
ncbi:MAG: hypothetical protein ABSF81_07730 [Bacteroidales bacterium]|jgi:hypothetical protein